ncbi:MAG: hypothetical protein JNM18_08650 [Planctomycetaceae bacterium]|nr:hypothetical protein [Planctomycetaceae bacterium]
MWQYIVALCACLQLVTGVLHACQHFFAGSMLMAAFTGLAAVVPRVWRMTNRILDGDQPPFGE